MCVDGEEGKADDSSDKNDKMNDEEEEGESGEVDSSSGEESSASSVVRPRCRRRHNPYQLSSTDSSDSTSDSSDSSSDSSDSSWKGHSWVVSTQHLVNITMKVIYVLLRLVGSTFSLGVSVFLTVVFTNNNNVVCAHVKYYVLL